MKLKLLFLIYFAAVLAVPGAVIFKHEQVLTQGKIYLFQTRPVDPYDLFRGRYVALAFEQDRVSYSGTDLFKTGDRVYVLLNQDSRGYARIEKILRKKPEAGDYLKARVGWHETTRWVYDETSQEGRQESVNLVHLQLPFSRFYMNEKKAPQAEALYREVSARPGAKEAYAQIRVLGGLGVIENLFVDGQPIAEKIKV